MHEKKQTEKKVNKKLLFWVMMVFGIILITIGTYGIAKKYASSHKKDILPNNKTVIAASTSEPSETEPSPEDVSQYNVPADQPRSIIISSLGISGLIQKVGLTTDNAVAVPTNIYYAGWYTNSVKPGDTGLSIIDGHVSGVYHDAIFKNLYKVNIKDIIEIEFGDGSIKKFQVVDRKVLPKDQSSDYLFTKNPTIESQLNLITCTGKFDKDTATFDKRVVIISTLRNY